MTLSGGCQFRSSYRVAGKGSFLQSCSDQDILQLWEGSVNGPYHATVQRTVLLKYNYCAARDLFRLVKVNDNYTYILIYIYIHL